MGWQEDQAARAREQQRQAFQQQLSKQRADQIRAENAAANKHARDVREAGFARQNAWNEGQRRKANEASARAHEETMKGLRSAPRTWGSISTPSVNHTDDSYTGASYAGSRNAKKKSGSGAFLVFLVIVGFIIYASSGSRNSPSPQSVTRDTSSNPASESATESPSEKPNPRSSEPILSLRPVLHDQVRTPEPAPEPAPEAPPQATEPPASSTANVTPALIAVPPLQTLTRVSPQYPEIAKRAGLRGTVVVDMSVSPDGLVANATSRTGNPILAEAAIDAAKRWRFNPYAAQPSDPLRRISVNFKFGDE